MNVLALASTTGLGDPGVSHGLLGFGASSAAVALVLVWLPAMQIFAAVLSMDVPFGGDLGHENINWPVLAPSYATEIVPAPQLAGLDITYPVLEPAVVE
jgi:hypothetical protein